MTVTLTSVTALISTRLITIEDYHKFPRYQLLPFSYPAFCEHVYRSSRFMEFKEDYEILRYALTCLNLYTEIFKSTKKALY